MRKLFKAGLVVFVTIFLATPNSFALNFQIDRAKVRVKLPAGWSDGGVITVDNRDSEPLKVRVYVSDWEYSEYDGSKNFMPANTTPKSCADWIKFYPADFTIPAFGKQKVNFVVGVPQGAVGGHYAVLFFEVQTGAIIDEARGTNVKVYNRLGSLFYVEPEGTIEKQAELSNFKISESGGNVKAEVTFRNTGNVDITTRGGFDIITEDGFVLTRGKFDDVYSMPEDMANLSATSLSSGFTKGTYDVIVTFDLGGSALVGEWQIEVDSFGRISGVNKVE